MLEILYPSSPAPLFPRPSADNPGFRPVADAEEMLPLVNEEGVVYGQACRKWCHSGSKALHPVVHLHIIDRFGKLFLQKRAPGKDFLPGYWDTAVGGHVSYGEQLLETLYREAAEEIGLTAFNPNLLESYVYESGRERELVFVFAAVGHPNLKPANAEVSEGRWWSFEELENLMGMNVLTPNFETEFERIKASLLSLL